MSSYFLNAAERGDLRTVKRMLGDGSARIGDTDENGNTALLISCRNGDLPTLQWLLSSEGGASIGERNDDGDSALLLSVRSGYLPMLQWLLSEGGANIRDSNKRGSTALLLAAGCSSDRKLPIVKWLLGEGGASIQEKDEDGDTALHVAALTGSFGAVKWLVEKKCFKADEINNSGSSALLEAASGGQLPIVHWLLEHGGSNMEQVDRFGTTIWALLNTYLVDTVNQVKDADVRVNPATVTALLRVMLLRGAPPASLTAKMAPEHVRVVEDGARLRAYLAQRRVLLDEHCPLLAPLQALVHGYETPVTTDELWAMDFRAVLKRPRSNETEPLLDRLGRPRKS
jgi:hypothetical protein